MVRQVNTDLLKMVVEVPDLVSFPPIRGADLDECADASTNICDELATYTNVSNSFKCTCDRLCCPRDTGDGLACVTSGKSSRAPSVIQ